MSEYSIAERLSELRTAKGLRQEAVAKALDVSNKTVSKWETGISEPGLSMLAAISRYFNVSSDYLLGIGELKDRTVNEAVRSEFRGLDRNAAILKAFDIAREIVAASYDVIAPYSAGIGDGAEALPPKSDRYRISTREFYDFVVSSEDVNMAVMLLGNESNFAWLDDADKRGKIAKMFTFLSDTDVLKVCAFIHSVSCSEHFTLDYAAKNTGVDTEKNARILDEACEVGLCAKAAAHLRSGEVTVYESLGEGKILALITLAYEHMCGRESYRYNFSATCKMLGGRKNESV